MPKKAKSEIRVGVGGWTYEPWRGTFYPQELAQKRELEYASRKLTSIEINGTYYGTQKPQSFAKWYDETPDDFVFALKGPRFTTNRRILAKAGESIERFFTSGVLRLKNKLGPINWQFMGTKKFDPEDFEGFLQLLPVSIEGIPIRHAVEVRHDSFRSPEFVDLARRHGVAIVFAADSEFPQIADPTAPFIYARLMGSSASETNGYSAAALEKWADSARVWARGAVPEGLQTVSDIPSRGRATPRDVFIYVISGEKSRNPAAAMALIERLR